MTPKTNSKFTSALIRAATIGPFMWALWAMRRGHIRAPMTSRRHEVAA